MRSSLHSAAACGHRRYFLHFEQRRLLSVSLPFFTFQENFIAVFYHQIYHVLITFLLSTAFIFVSLFNRDLCIISLAAFNFSTYLKFYQLHNSLSILFFSPRFFNWTQVNVSCPVSLSCVLFLFVIFTLVFITPCILLHFVLFLG